MFMPDIHVTIKSYQTISERVHECEKDSQKLYTLVNNLIGRVQTNPMPKEGTTSSLPNRFADCFLSKIMKIRG